MSEIQNRIAKLKLEIKQAAIEEVLLQKFDLLLDCREQEEIELGLIPNAVWIPKGRVDLSIEEKYPDKSKNIIVYCGSGYRSVLVAKSLLDLGYKNVSSLAGGIQNWKNLGHPIFSFKNTTQLNKKRYLSQLRVPEIGEAGQLKIQSARVLVIGAGGLGSPVALYLAAAGVGKLGIIDSDIVDESNLQRQVLHTTDRIGLKKVDSAFLTLKSINPQIEIVPYAQRIDAHNIDQIFEGFDIIVDGTDNFETRYLVNLACLKNSKVNVHGSVLRFQGHVTVFGIESGPCYSCIFPEPPVAELQVDCAQGGVLGAVVGVIGTIMAVEVVKIILGVGDLLNGRLLAFDGLHGEFDNLHVKKNPSCPTCSTRTANLNYDAQPKIMMNCKLEN